jgi:hypothetical protein
LWTQAFEVGAAGFERSGELEAPHRQSLKTTLAKLFGA